MKVILNEQQQLLVQLHERKESSDDFAKRLWRLTKSSAGMGEQRLAVYDYLFELKDSSLINMFEATPWVCNGSKWVSAMLVTMHKKPNEYKAVVNKADNVRDAIIQICMSNYDKIETPELDDEDVNDILSYVSHNMMKVARDLVMIWSMNYKRLSQIRKITCVECGHRFEAEDEILECPNCGHVNGKEPLNEERIDDILQYAEKKGMLSGEKEVVYQYGGHTEITVHFTIERVVHTKDKAFGETDQVLFIINNLKGWYLSSDTNGVKKHMKVMMYDSEGIINAVGSYFEQFIKYFGVRKIYIRCLNKSDWNYYWRLGKWAYSHNTERQFKGLI
jgi:hypothetical protein